MTTIEGFIGKQNISKLNFDIAKIEPTNYKKEDNKIIFSIAEVIAFPLIALKNLRALFLTARLKRSLIKMLTSVEKMFEMETEERRIEFYASFDALRENVNESCENEDILNPKGGYLTKKVCKNIIEMRDFLNEKDAFFYRVAYPNNRDENSEDFIKEVLAAHANYDS